MRLIGSFYVISSGYWAFVLLFFVRFKLGLHHFDQVNI